MVGLGGRTSALLRRLTKRSSSNFKFAFLFLGKEQREALKLVYEYCRVVDDIVDERPAGPEGEAAARVGLDLWRQEIARIYAEDIAACGPPETELGQGLARTHALFHYPREGFDEIIAGCEMDLEQTEYATAEDLRTYCYRVASCVGLLCIAIFGDQTESARAYAIHLGLALQYTNILRDVAEDAVRGRVYLPKDLLARHGLTAADVLDQVYDQRFVDAAGEFAALAETEYQLAWKRLPEVNARALLPAEIMGRTYYQILVETRARDFNVFARRAALRRRDKLKVAALAIARSGLSVV